MPRAHSMVYIWRQYYVGDQWSHWTYYQELGHRLACQSTSQQYYSFILNQHQPPITSQSAVLFSHNKSAPAISHNQTNTASSIDGAPHLHHRELYPWSYFLKDVSLRFQKRCVFLSECNSYHRYRIGIELHNLQMFSEGSLAVVVEHHYIWLQYRPHQRNNLCSITSATLTVLYHDLFN